MGFTPEIVIEEFESEGGDVREDFLSNDDIREESKKIRKDEIQSAEEELVSVENEKVRDVLNMFGARVVEIKDRKKD